MEEGMGTLGRHLTNAYNQMGQVSTSFIQLGQKLSHTQLIEAQSETDEE